MKKALLPSKYVRLLARLNKRGVLNFRAQESTRFDETRNWKEQLGRKDMGDAPTAASGMYAGGSLEETLERRKTGPGDTVLPISQGQDIGGPAFDIMDYDFSDDERLPMFLKRLEFLEKYYDAIIPEESFLKIGYNYFTKEAYFVDGNFNFNGLKFIKILLGDTNYVTVGDQKGIMSVNITIENSQGNNLLEDITKASEMFASLSDNNVVVFYDEPNIFTAEDLSAEIEKVRTSYTHYTYYTIYKKPKIESILSQSPDKIQVPIVLIDRFGTRELVEELVSKKINRIFNRSTYQLNYEISYRIDGVMGKTTQRKLQGGAGIAELTKLVYDDLVENMAEIPYANIEYEDLTRSQRTVINSMIDDFIQSNIAELGSYYDDKAGKVRGALFSGRNLMDLFEDPNIEKDWEGFTGEGSTEFTELDDFFEIIGNNYKAGKDKITESVNLGRFSTKFGDYIYKSFKRPQDERSPLALTEVSLRVSGQPQVQIDIFFKYQNYSGGGQKTDDGSITINLQTELMRINPSMSDASIYPRSAIRIEIDPFRPMTEIMRVMSELFGRDVDTGPQLPLFTSGDVRRPQLRASDLLGRRTLAKKDLGGEIIYYEPIRNNPVLGTSKGGVVLLNMEDANQGGNIISMDSLAVTLYGGTAKRNICNQALSFLIADQKSDNEQKLYVSWNTGSPTCVHGKNSHPWAGDEALSAVDYVKNLLAFRSRGASINQFQLGSYKHSENALQLIKNLGLTKMQFKNLLALLLISKGLTMDDYKKPGSVTFTPNEIRSVNIRQENEKAKKFYDKLVEDAYNNITFYRAGEEYDEAMENPAEIDEEEYVMPPEDVEELDMERRLLQRDERRRRKREEEEL